MKVNAIKLSTQHYVNGENVKDLTQAQCMNIIAQGEADIATLEALTTKSEAITAQIANIKAGLEEVAKILDKKAKRANS